MKKAIFILTFALLATAVFSQVKVSTDKHGNYFAIETNADTTGTKTGKTFTAKNGQVFPVYLNNSRLFIVRTSKTGKVYKQYLKLEN